MSKSDLGQSSDSDTNVWAAATGATTKPTRWQRFKAHMKKWWWAYLFGFCCVFLVVFLPLIYVGIPHFADSYINSFQYDDTGLAITNPRPNAFHVSQKKSISMGGGFSGSGYLSPFNATIRVPDSGEEFAVFPVPEIQFDGGTTLDIDQDLDLSCVECLSQLALSAATNKSFAVLVTGQPDLKFGALPTAHLNIHKTMDMNGYNVTEFVNTPGAFNVTSVDILDNPVNGFNINATISIQNPTPFIVEMGHVTFNLSMAGKSLGYVDLPNLMLEQPTSSTIVLGQIDTGMLIDQAINGDGEGFTVTIDVRGHSCDYNGLDIPYFAAAIKAVRASATIDLSQYASSLLG
ncbi:hypothetical protein N7474_006803 [Penicillium riverlandense]|uniref:uncharacterized protein n=1 Tax=Penicillium riverlandense TaxID=1903569 RepID=UPI00254957E0|nr:uncharacterized protein N7474_006803 [Penicillium riverlandense]KAJ5815026.1 hypothetical protein N7474_006803 [Penicillium riverlandense]